MPAPETEFSIPGSESAICSCSFVRLCCAAVADRGTVSETVSGTAVAWLRTYFSTRKEFSRVRSTGRSLVIEMSQRFWCALCLSICLSVYLSICLSVCIVDAPPPCVLNVAAGLLAVTIAELTEFRNVLQVTNHIQTAVVCICSCARMMILTTRTHAPVPAPSSESADHFFFLSTFTFVACVLACL